MALSSREYVAVPPDGAGKKLGVGHAVRISYTNAVGLDAFLVGDEVSGATSNATGTVIEARPLTATTGDIDVDFRRNSLNANYSDGEDLEVGGQVRAVVGQSENFYLSRTQVVGGNNARFVQTVDVLGAANVRYNTGSPSFDAAGRTEVSGENWIGNYSQQADEMPDLISTTLTGAGSLTWEAASRTTELVVDDVSGSSVIRQTNLHHHYRPGVAMSALMTVAADAPTTNCVRRWGFFDENDGLFFEYDGTTMYVVERSSTSGSVVETRIPQSQWNGDRMDGTGNTQTNPSVETLDPQQFWLYEISFLFLGAGPARFSVFSDEGRTILHTFRNGGENTVPYMRTGSLPLRWEIVNTGATAGPTQLRQGNATVHTIGDWAPQRKSYGSPFRAPISVNGQTAVSVLRAAQTNPLNGLDNRGLIIPTELRVYSATEPVFVLITRGGDFTVDAWASDHADSLLEVGTQAGGPPPIISEGRTVYSALVNPGDLATIDLRTTFSVRADGEIIRKADITDWVNHAVICQSVTGVATDVNISFNWDEIV